ncbi:MAG: GTPase Era [Mariprofundaceae bacterium]|nr:GTPase Era [Mariprofundaceae bacterium]
MEDNSTKNIDYHCGTIALLGRPNTGKSTLLNQIIGTKVAIVTSKPQTTRNRILGIHTDEESQMIFIDTPGIHKGRSRLTKNMVRLAYEVAKEADVLLVMQDVSKPLDQDSKNMIQHFVENEAHKPRIHILNKVDKIKKEKLFPRLLEIQKIDPEAQAYIPLSAIKGKQLAGLQQELIKALPKAAAKYDEDMFTDQSQRQLVAEFVREQVFMAMQEEIPFQTAVHIEDFREFSNEKIEVDALIIVGCERHKPMLLGKEGERIKHIGTYARKHLEEVLGCHVHLNLWVKSQPNWFENPSALSELGLNV